MNYLYSIDKGVVLHQKIYIFSFLFAFFSLYSQRYNTQIYNTDNDLPQDSIKDITEDRFCFIGFTKENAIVRLDGLHFLDTRIFHLASSGLLIFMEIMKKTVFSLLEITEKLCSMQLLQMIERKIIIEWHEIKGTSFR
ncbi:hypothetical protein C1637_06050 [Chryseobacterium lactis]|uniref:Uncharacterized protein n=1 Tax=Chryseobacterium lactis TaxID=1241981 RepID=A0A3G6RTH5_CHRLC|nr:hypothetical protein [Chryseobacterium lactis]AZA84402.1 hypothetical protein EG342_22020 [Chryseobacterium lactis]AZB04790.1 hypothetical protein EG341_12900 [Chryseobacterium lactis]PNW14521.1 hypothetical protein C1637_06050 [Chryseobacterium lactis]